MRLAKLTGLEIEKLEAELKEVRAHDQGAQEHPAPASPSGWASSSSEMDEVVEEFGDDRRTEILSRPGRVHGRGPDRRRGHGDHHLPLGLHQADPDHHLQAAAPRAAGASTGPTSRPTTGSSTCSSPAPTTTCCSSPTRGSSTGSRCTRSRRRGRAARGKPVVNCIAIKPDEQIAALVPVREFTDDKCLIFATRKGTVKKTVLSAYGNVRDQRHLRHQHREGRRADRRPGLRRRTATSCWPPGTG